MTAEGRKAATSLPCQLHTTWKQAASPRGGPLSPSSVNTTQEFPSISGSRHQLPFLLLPPPPNNDLSYLYFPPQTADTSLSMQTERLQSTSTGLKACILLDHLLLTVYSAPCLRQHQPYNGYSLISALEAVTGPTTVFMMLQNSASTLPC